MASTHKHIRSSTANKRPTTAIADGQIALNTNSASPGLFFKDSTGATIIKIGPVHVGATAPNASPAAGGSAGNSTGEIWLDNSLTPVGVKIWNGSAWVNATPIGSTTVQGLLELATDAETQAGSDTARAITPASLQSKVSDSTSTTSSTTIASSTAVKAAYDLANAALPKTGGTITGNLEIGTTGSLSFEGSTADGFETTIAVVDPTADRTITLPNTTGTVVTTGDTGTVTSTMIANDTIVNADINSAAAIAGTKISPDFGSQTITTSGLFSHALGTAGAPTITFTGDTNTGIYSPGADQVAISTGGSGRLFVEADGDVCIGQNAGNSQLTVKGSTSTRTVSQFIANDTNTTTMSVWERSDGAVSSRLIYDGTGLIKFGTSTAHALTLDTSNQERLRITSAGLVGVGTSSPSAKLDVEASNFAGGPAIGARYNTSNVRLGFNVANSNGFTYIGSNTNNKLSSDTATYDLTGQPASQLRLDGGQLIFNNAPIGTAGNDITFTNRLTITSAGLVGIGTTAPQSPLVVSNGGANGIEFGPINGDIFTYNRSTSAYTNTQITCNEFVVRTNGSNERARIDSSGRLLVGTSSGSDNNALLKVQGNVGGTTGTGWIDIRRGLTTPGSGSQLGLLSFSDASGNNYAFIDAYVDATPGTNDYPGRLVFSTTADGASSPTERMRIDNTGRVGVNGLNTDSQLSVKSTSTTAAQRWFHTTGAELMATAGYGGVFTTGANAASTALYVQKDSSINRSINAAGTVNASGADYAEYMVKAGDFIIAKGAVCGVTADGLLTLDYGNAVSFVVKSTNPSYVGGDTWGSEDVVGKKPDAEDTEALAQWEADLEAARQKVDRIAFAGQVPVNVMGAAPGQYIVPVEAADGGIEGVAKNKSDMTAAEYMDAVGKVIAIEDDGRARIIVKVA